jgi:hypothetical protein
MSHRKRIQIAFKYVTRCTTSLLRDLKLKLQHENRKGQKVYIGAGLEKYDSLR